MLIVAIFCLFIGQAPSRGDFPDSEEMKWLTQGLGFTHLEIEEHYNSRRDFHQFLMKSRDEWNRLAAIQNDSTVSYEKRQATTQAMMMQIARDSPISEEYRRRSDLFDREKIARQQRLIDSGIRLPYHYRIFGLSPSDTAMLLVTPSHPINQSDTELAEMDFAMAQAMKTAQIWERWWWVMATVTIGILLAMAIFALLVIARVGRTSLGARIISPRIIAITEKRTTLCLAASGLVVVWLVYNMFSWGLPWRYAVFLWSHDVSRLEAMEEKLNDAGVNTILVTSDFPNTKVWLGNRLLGTAPLGLPNSYLSWITSSDSVPPPEGARRIDIMNPGQHYIIGVTVDHLDPDFFAIARRSSSGNQKTLNFLMIGMSNYHRNRIKVVSGQPPLMPIHNRPDTADR